MGRLRRNVPFTPSVFLDRCVTHFRLVWQRIQIVRLSAWQAHNCRSRSRFILAKSINRPLGRRSFSLSTNRARN